MSSIQEVNRSLLYLLVFTAISSAIAYGLILEAYDKVFAIGFYGM